MISFLFLHIPFKNLLTIVFSFPEDFVFQLQTGGRTEETLQVPGAVLTH